VDVAGLLELAILRDARVVAGADHLRRAVRVVAAVDHPQPLPFVRADQLVLTTGYAWPRTPYEQRLLIKGLAGRGVAAVGVAVPQYIDRVPAAANEEAERQGLPMLEIPWEIPFSELTLELNSAIFREQYRVIEQQLRAIQQSERIHRTVTRAAMDVGSLEDLAGSLGSLLGRDVAFEDAQGQLLGVYARSGSRDAVERELAAARLDAADQMLRDQTRDRARAQSGAQDRDQTRTQGGAQDGDQSRDQSRLRVRPQAGAVLVEGGESGSGARVLCPIRMHDEVEGWVWIWGGDAPIGELDARASEHAALVAGLTIAHQRSIARTEAQLGYTFVDSLLDGRAGANGSADALLERARLQGFRHDGRYRVALMALAVPQPLSTEDLALRERLIGDLRLLLRRQGTAPLLSPSTTHIRLLLPERVDPERLWEQITGDRTLSWSQRKDMLALVVGRLVTGPANIRQAYREVLTVVPSLRFGAIQNVKGALVLATLQGDTAARDLLVREVFRPLADRPELCRTLEALAASGFQQRAAAATLEVHVNTLRYRIARIEELTGLDLAEPEARFRVQLACHASLLLPDNQPQQDL